LLSSYAVSIHLFGAIHLTIIQFTDPSRFLAKQLFPLPQGDRPAFPTPPKDFLTNLVRVHVFEIIASSKSFAFNHANGPSECLTLTSTALTNFQELKCEPVQGSGRLFRQFAQGSDIPDGRMTEMPLVLPAELRLVLVSDLKTCFTGI